MSEAARSGIMQEPRTPGARPVLTTPVLAMQPQTEADARHPASTPTPDAPEASPGRRQGEAWVTDFGFAAIMTGIIVLFIVATAVVTGGLYHNAVYGNYDAGAFVGVGILAAAFYVLPLVYRDALLPHSWLARRRRRLATVAIGWTRSFAWLLVIGFMTKTSADYSRGWLLLFFIAGLVSLLLLEIVLVTVLRWVRAAGRLAPRRVAVIGDARSLDRLRLKARRPELSGLEIAAAWRLPTTRNLSDPADQAQMRAFLDGAVSEAREKGVRDVLILTDWSDEATIDATVSAFSMMPVSVHLDADRVLKRFGEIRIERLGPVFAAELTEHPVAPLEALVKRAFDVVVALTMLVALSPVLAAIAIAIKLDSRGPVLFKQRRLGYNQREFRILKFRSMTTLDDGDTIVQAQKNDARITRVGGFLRRSNLDELPQLINVLRGEMSIVGPRPHAVAHDRFFEKRILAYPRRTNVKPGITGWAQVNGLRGETDTDEKMRARVEHDLYYIDNWSMGLDLYILVLTVLSPRSYRNAG